LDLDQAIRERHSTRLFLPQPVPRELVNEALALAQYAPSNSNIQPWHMVFASGASRDRLVAALIDKAQRRPPNIPPLPASFQHFRSELGAQVYGAMGIMTRQSNKFYACRGGNPAIPLPAAPIAVRARPKTRQWRSLSRNPRKSFSLSVNYLTLLNRFLNDAA
jgi:nitroreductase